jgi:AcrR family transcriptional regulator
MPRDRRTIGPRRERRVVRGRRLRRTPEQARQELLDAAERVFAEYTPDEVGLKQVAREAGVSHALITHYFGTYGGLVEATLERRIRVMRAEILVQLRQAGALARPNELLGMLFETLRDPIHLKLVKWLVASERVASLRGLAFHEQGLLLIASEVAQALSPPLGREAVDTIGLALLTAVAAAYGYALNKYALAAGLGRVANAELDADVQRTLAEMLQAFLRSRLGPGAPV